MNPTCRHCQAPLERVFVDLGHMPPANSYREPGDESPEPKFPLRAMVCDECLLVQLDTTVPPEDIFADGYAYFSSTSPSWVAEAKRKCGHLIDKLELTEDSLVVEVGSNDGYLLRHFVERGVPVLGIDPAKGCAEEAERCGVPTRAEFFGLALAEELGPIADVVTGTNVFAHVPDINDFVAGLSRIVKPEGVVIMEFPHLLRLIEECQFDTIYHEHYFYFSLRAVQRIFAHHGLTVFDVEVLPTHGGSLRVFAGNHPVDPSVEQILKQEDRAKLDRPEGYDRFSDAVKQAARDFRYLLIEHEQIAAYGAPAKGSTFLNYCGVGPDQVAFTVDDSPHKQGKLMPGSRIPIVGREHLLEQKPSHMLILPWNLEFSIRERNPEVEKWGGKWVTAIPQLAIRP